MQSPRYRRFLIPIIVAAFVGLVLLIATLCPQGDNGHVDRICTLMIVTALETYAEENEGWYPILEQGRYEEFSPELQYQLMPVEHVAGPQWEPEEILQWYEREGIEFKEVSRFAYVEGLRRDDPPHLIVMYMKRPTRWRKHFEEPQRSAKWLVRHPDDAGHWANSPEGWINTPLFRKRLEETLQFLENNKRPHWERTLKEHEAFLEYLEEHGEAPAYHPRIWDLPSETTAQGKPT